MTLTQHLEYLERTHPRSKFKIKLARNGDWVASAYVWTTRDLDVLKAVNDLHHVVVSHTIRALPSLSTGCVWTVSNGIYKARRASVLYARARSCNVTESDPPPPFSIVWDPVRNDECLYVPEGS